MNSDESTHRVKDDAMGPGKKANVWNGRDHQELAVAI